jgi:multiple sugar transport system ATP-binding protein
MTVFDNIAFGLKMRGVPRAVVRERVTGIAGTLGLTDLLRRRPRQLSGGQRQRVAMGRAIVREPAVFLLDEPLSNLDARLRSQMRSEITSIQRDVGATTIYVTHDQVEAMTMGDRVAVMRHGRLQQVGTPDVLYFAPANLFVASFLGNPPMNLFEARLTREVGSWLLHLDDQTLGPLPASTVSKEAAATLGTLEGAVVGVGIRPENLQENTAGDRQDRLTLRGTVSLTEALGSDRLLHLELRARPVVSDAVLEVAEDTDATAREQLRMEASERRAQVIARVPPMSRPGIGDTVELCAPTNAVYIFDLATGLASHLTGGVG